LRLLIIASPLYTHIKFIVTFLIPKQIWGHTEAIYRRKQVSSLVTPIMDIKEGCDGGKWPIY